MITTIANKQSEQVFTDVHNLVENCLNLWSPAVSSSVQLLATDGSVLLEQAFAAKCLEAPSNLADFRLVHDAFATIIEPTQFKIDYFNFLAMCNF